MDSGLSDIEQYLDHGNANSTSGEYYQSSNNQMSCDDTLSENDSSLDTDPATNTLETLNEKASVSQNQLETENIIGTDKAISSNAPSIATDGITVLSNTSPTIYVASAMCVNNDKIYITGINNTKTGSDVNIDDIEITVMGVSTDHLEEPKNRIGKNTPKMSTDVVTSRNTEVCHVTSLPIRGNTSTVGTTGEDVFMRASHECNTENGNEHINNDMNQNSATSVVRVSEAEVSTTKDKFKALFLTKLCKTLVQSINIVPSLKDCCHLSMSGQTTASLINTKLSNIHTTNDHSCGFGYKQCPIEKSCKYDVAESDFMGTIESPQIDNIMDSADNISIVIDSMAEDVPVCLSDILYTKQVDLHVTSNDDQMPQLDTSDDSLPPVRYDPTGTELILPPKKRKPIVQNLENNVTELWKNDALTCEWSIPLTKLDSRKLYKLSQKPPNWSEMV